MSETWLVFGKTGWIGPKVGEIAEKLGYKVVYATSRLEAKEDVAKELDTVKPARVLNAAGLTGRPNVDWCESHKIETIRVNVIGTLTLADLCLERNIHLTVYATGCIYEFDADHPMYSGKGFKEDDKPNFKGSFYSLSKGMVDELLKSYPNTLVLRVRMPLSDEYEHPRNFITKITHYRRVVNVPNSMTDLDGLLPVSVDMAKNKRTGTYNFTNPGAISHNEILTLYRDIVHPDFKWENFSIEEQTKILVAGRSNNELDASKLHALYPSIPEIHEAVKAMMHRMKARVPPGTPAPVPSKQRQWTGDRGTAEN